MPKSAQGKTVRTLSQTTTSYYINLREIYNIGTAFFCYRLWESAKKKKTEIIKFTTKILENINQCLEDGERKRFIIEGQL
jgi:hypothetical protein